MTVGPGIAYPLSAYSCNESFTDADAAKSDGVFKWAHLACDLFSHATDPVAERTATNQCTELFS